MLYMVHYKLIRSQDGKEYKWSRESESTAHLKSEDDYITYYSNITIDTWKGRYTLNHQPKSYERGLKHSTWDFETLSFVVAFSWPGYVSDLKYVYHPLKQEWIIAPNMQIGRAIQNDLLQWILEQPPQLKQMKAIYEKDRVDVEATFTNILAEKQNETTPNLNS